jgi:hypothetical protein
MTAAKRWFAALTSAGFALNGAIKIMAASLNLEVGLIDIPAATDLAAPTPQILRQGKGELDLPGPHCLMAVADPHSKHRMQVRSRVMVDVMPSPGILRPWRWREP